MHEKPKSWERDKRRTARLTKTHSVKRVALRGDEETKQRDEFRTAQRQKKLKLIATSVAPDEISS